MRKVATVEVVGEEAEQRQEQAVWESRESAMGPLRFDRRFDTAPARAEQYARHVRVVDKVAAGKDEVWILFLDTEGTGENTYQVSIGAPSPTLAALSFRLAECARDGSASARRRAFRGGAFSAGHRGRGV